MLPLLITLLATAFFCRNILYKYVPANEEIPLYQTRVFMPDTLNASLWLQCYRHYFVVGDRAFAYEKIQSVSLIPKKFTFRPEIRIHRYEDDINTHRYLFFYAGNHERIVQEIQDGVKRAQHAVQALIEE